MGNKKSRWAYVAGVMGVAFLAFAGVAQAQEREQQQERAQEPGQPQAEGPNPALERTDPQPAQDGDDDLGETGEPLAAGERRPTPDYDGRGDEPVGAEGLLWVPRILFFPLYFVSEYIIRWPLGLLVTEAERTELPSLLIDFFTFGPENKSGVVPTALFDFGFRPSIGLYAFGDDFLFDDNDLRIHGAYGGRDWLSLAITNRVETETDRSWLSLSFWAVQRPDYLFFGLGPSSDSDHESRYQAIRLGSALELEVEPFRASSLLVTAGVESVDFRPGTCCEAPSLRTRVDQGDFAEPAGFEQDYTRYSTRVELAIDTRRDRPAPGTGIRLAVEGEHAFDLRDPLERRWMKYGGTLGLYLDAGGHNRVLGLSVTALFADPFGETEIPFTEQITLGGMQHMRGFREGRLVGRSALVGTLEYRWPIWIWLDGTMHAAVGNVFGAHLDGVSLAAMRLSTGIGFRALAQRDHSFDFIVGFGSEPFDDFEISSFRLLIGATRGF